MNNYSKEQLFEMIKNLGEFEVLEIKRKDSEVVATLKSTFRATIDI